MPSPSIKKYLEDQHISFRSINHSPGFTAQEVAASAHISGKQLAKIVVIKIDNKLALMVLPANEHVNFASLKEATGINADLASESEFKNKFPECEVGAMPPFGDLYHMNVYVSSHLAKNDQIAFNGGSHSELIQLAYKDFEKLAHPIVIFIESDKIH